MRGLVGHVRTIKARKKALCKPAWPLYGCEANSALSPEGLQQDSEVCLTPGEPCLSARHPAVQKDKMSHKQGSRISHFSVKLPLYPKRNVSNSCKLLIHIFCLLNSSIEIAASNSRFSLFLFYEDVSCLQFLSVNN